MPPPARSIRLDELAARAGAVLEGDGAVQIDRVATLENAGEGAIAFLANPKYKAQLATTQASAVIVGPTAADATALPKLINPNPYATYARVAALLHPAALPPAGVHPSAVIAPTARVAASASIGPNVVIGGEAEIGERVVLGPGTVIGDGAVLGADVMLVAYVVVYPRTRIGPRTLVHAGAVIGSDGFGMAEEGGRWLKIPQVGRVVIGADVEIGANTTIDRGAIDDTVIGDDVKIDNQVQIGHNVVIGAHTAIAGCVGIAGSARIGRNCKLGGAAMIAGHIEIADGAVISGATQVYDSLPEAGIYTASFPAMPHAQWRRVMAELRHLRELAERVRALERAASRDEKGA